jgi:hypothetical protein
MNRVLEHLIIYLQWFIVTSIAFPVGMIAASVLLVSIGIASDSIWLTLGTFSLTGILVGFAQLIVLGGKVSNSSVWLGLSAIGVGVGGWTTVLVLSGSSTLLSAILAGLLGGLAAGLLQVGSLRSTSWKRGEWLLLTPLSWMLAILTGSLFLSQGTMLSSLQGIGPMQSVMMTGWAISGLVAVLLLLFFTPIAKRRELSGRIVWLP